MTMTDNEIIKALECCISGLGAAACESGCPFHEKEICLKDCVAVEKFALDLINRQQAENDDLFYKLQGVMWFVDKWLDGDELKQDEVTRAITMREKTLQIVEQKQAEIERLEFSNEHWNDWEVKCRAIVEFADRLKELIRFYYPNQNFIHTHIDNLVKEMTEQRKEDEGK